MVGMTVRGKSVAKACRYISQFSSLVTERVKIGLVKVKMAVMKSSGFSEYSTSEIGKHIANCCINEENDAHPNNTGKEQQPHPCYSYIRSGVAGNYVQIGLTGFGQF